MLKNDNLNRVLAVIVAIVLWAYVVGYVNPAADAVIHDVPINFINQDTLEKDDLMLLSSSNYSVDIAISGQRADVSKTDVSDFNVTCDVSSLKMGDNSVKLKVDGPSDIKIDHISTERITVVIDEKVVAEKPIKVVIEGEVDADKEASVLSIEKNTISVVGPKTSVNKVASMVAYLKATDITSEKKTFSLDVVPVDNSGNLVERVRTSGNSKINVSAIMFMIKSVNLEVPVTNQNANDIERTYSVPKTIVIKGTKEDLDEVGLIKCKPVDLAKVTVDTDIVLSPILPEGVSIASSSKDISMSVIVKDNVKKTFELTKDKIILKGAREDTVYDIEDVKYTIEITGRASIVNTIDITDISITADVSALNEESGIVKLTATCSKEVNSVVVSPNEVKITLS